MRFQSKSPADFFFFGNKIDKLTIIILEIAKTVLKKKNGFGGAEGC